MLGLAGVSAGVLALFAVMTVFGGMFFVLALHFQVDSASRRCGLG